MCQINHVVLLAEDVDRNNHIILQKISGRTSSSSRRTWIEISLLRGSGDNLGVVLLAEDVDRNKITDEASSAIEVVLLAEDVDRNTLKITGFGPMGGRPPRGGRG